MIRLFILFERKTEANSVCQEWQRWDQKHGFRKFYLALYFPIPYVHDLLMILHYFSVPSDSDKVYFSHNCMASIMHIHFLQIF